MNHHRKYRNLALTKEFHFRYLGLWAVIAVALMCTNNITLFLWIQEHFASSQSILSPEYQLFDLLKNRLIVALIIETIIFSIGIVALARLTAHRIAGPYIRLRRTFEAIRDGNPDLRLRFRDYDNLDPVAKAFNEMMDAFHKKP